MPYTASTSVSSIRNAAPVSTARSAGRRAAIGSLELAAGILARTSVKCVAPSAFR